MELKCTTCNKTIGFLAGAIESGNYRISLHSVFQSLNIEEGTFNRKKLQPSRNRENGHMSHYLIELTLNIQAVKSS